MLPSRVKLVAGRKPLYHYVVVRADLPTGVAMAQAVHAAGESADPLPLSGTHAVVLGVPDERSLLRVAEKLDRRGIPHKLICEPDFPWLGQAMAIGLAPVGDRRRVSRVLGRLNLLE